MAGARDWGDGRRPGGLLAAATGAAAAFDFATDQGTGGGAEDGPGGALATGIDRAASQGTGGTADDQAGRAVGTLAAQAALRIAPGLAVVAILRRGRGGRDDGDGERRGSECQEKSTQRKFPELFVVSLGRSGSTCMNVACKATLG